MLVELRRDVFSSNVARDQKTFDVRAIITRASERGRERRTHGSARANLNPPPPRPPPPPLLLLPPLQPVTVTDAAAYTYRQSIYTESARVSTAATVRRQYGHDQ